jgi:fucose 4-O-acetylase-like acetyltransferase
MPKGRGFTARLVKKSSQMLLPWFVWCVLLGLCWNLLFNRQLFENGIITVLKQFFYSNSGTNSWFWFLREIFISYCITYVCYKIFKKWIFVSISACIAVYFLPFDTLWMNQRRVFLPYFMAGILVKNNYHLIVKHMKIILLFSAVLYLSLLPFWGIGYWTNPKIFSC